MVCSSGEIWQHAVDLKSTVREDVPVRVRSGAPVKIIQCCRCEYRRGADAQNPREGGYAEAASMAVGLLQHLHK